ncbi:AAA family ATPase [Pontibacter ruber]|uniref:AAA family ATPase n=1 Tax=Pontibacter ruber TaxID=1343895 RepID=A0ABW5CXQ2_9BACT|nr:AAA family ATPase [Pontibacter ruber]
MKDFNQSASEEMDAVPNIITAKALAQLKAPISRYLLEPFLPTSGTALIAGKPDTGKSQFARQLAIQVSQGSSEFLNFKLSLKHGRSVYVATEDDAWNTQYLIAKQHQGLGYEPNENLSFLFSNSMDTKRVIKELDKLLTLAPVDLIVVDGFSDIFSGSDMNSNTQMRESINKFDYIAKKHHCLILFVHHINKSAYDKKATQQSIQGGGALAQKVRLAWQLTSQEGGNTKFLNVTKGNYCPREYKEKPQVLVFDESHFTFTKSSNPINEKQQELNLEPALSKNESKLLSFLQDIKTKLLETQGIKYGAFVKFMMEEGQFPEASAKRQISQLKEQNYIVKIDDLYKWEEKPIRKLNNREIIEGDISLDDVA